ncbi:DUF1203 domain-containing protein [Stenotrophomonas sp. Iso1]|uniref:DUF1203 domain-containing protein n=1 Tax=Stenotrophomonas sp. Iso1 TaxID=2977283 RepID=UPI0022B7CEC8|nr:DUF1203 domain-containing protein [Stenotrophomonas sp. Iso1]
MSSFILRGLSADTFAPLFHLDDAALAARHIKRVVADDAKRFPCRVSLVDAAVGEALLLLPYQHQPADSPYRASGPIFVRRDAVAADLAVDEVPAAMIRRLISLRAYDAAHRIIDAEVCDGTAVAAWLQRAFDDAAVAYVHLHHARYGCYACRADRAPAGKLTCLAHDSAQSAEQQRRECAAIDFHQGAGVAGGASLVPTGGTEKMAKPFPLKPKHPERICWGCDRYCATEALACGNGSGRTQHPIETQGEDWYVAWGIEPEPDRPSHAKLKS